jgi:hypothetical protein
MLDGKATQKADRELWAKFPELQGRKLTSSPADAKYREQWWSAYNSAKGGGASQTPPPSSKPVGAVIQACPLTALCPQIDAMAGMPLNERFTKEAEIMQKMRETDPKKAASFDRQLHDRDMGVLANSTYATSDGSPSILPPGYQAVGPEDLDKLGLTPAQLEPDIDILRKDTGDGPPHYVLAFRGTELGAGRGTAANDVGTDVLQAVGFDTDAYNKGIATAKAMQMGAKKMDPPATMEMTGHSKGGGQAAAASAATGAPATTFNAAGVHPRTLQRAGATEAQKEAAKTNVRAYNNAADPLNAAQDHRGAVLGTIAAATNPLVIAALAVDGALPQALGERVEVPAATGQSKLGGHSMDNLVKAMNEQLDAKLKKAAGCGKAAPAPSSALAAPVLA